MSGDMTARLWDTDRGSSESEICVFKGHGRSVKCIAFKPNIPNEFATGSRENSILLWDIRDPAKVIYLVFRDACFMAKFNTKRII